MILDLREVFSEKKKSIQVEQQIDMSDFEQAGIHPIEKPVRFEGMVKNTAGIVKLIGTAYYEYSAPCDRCAEPHSEDMSCELEHIIVQEISNEDDEEFIIAENMQLDIDELVRTDIILNLPFVFLCREDCKGICAGCGKMLNYENCICEKEIDPRLAVLDDFFN